jgi:plasmid stability protein
MARTVPWSVETDETVLRALELRAAREGTSLSDALQAVLRQALAAEIDEVSGTVPLAAMIQKVIRQRDLAARSRGGQSVPL